MSLFCSELSQRLFIANSKSQILAIVYRVHVTCPHAVGRPPLPSLNLIHPSHPAGQLESSQLTSLLLLDLPLSLRSLRPGLCKVEGIVPFKCHLSARPFQPLS